MKRYIYVLFSLLTCCVTLSAQPQLKLSAMRHDFGSILWKQPVTAVFEVTNAGSSPLQIEEVKADCGCTLVDWPRTKIKTGQSGEIKVTFDAELLGRFTKQLAVKTNESATPFYLTISGDVVMEKKDFSSIYDCQIGDIYLDADNVEFDDVQMGDIPFKTLTLFNAGRQSYKPTLMHLPKYITVKCEPEIILPGQKGFLNIILHSEQLRSLGLTQTNIYLSRYPGDQISTENEILVSATLLPEFDLTETQKLNAPAVKLTSSTLDLGAFDGKSKLKGDIEIENTGKSDLEISALQVYTPAIHARLRKSKLKPGAKTKLSVTVYGDRLHFKGRRRVLLITNDPQKPKVTVDIIVKS